MRLSVLFIVFMALHNGASVAEDNLGKVRLYHTDSDNLVTAELLLVPFGNPAQRLVLAHFRTRGFSVDGEYNVYVGECETTDCKTVFYRVVGGKAFGFVSRESYYGHRIELLLMGRKDALPVYHDEKLSSRIRSADVFQDYLKSVGRNQKGNDNASAVDAALEKDLRAMNTACKTNALLKTEKKEFQNTNTIHLLGMGAVFMREVATRCTDPDYLRILSGIRSVKLLPSPKRQTAELADGTLRIYLSSDTYNPRYEAISWLDSL